MSLIPFKAFCLLSLVLIRKALVRLFDKLDQGTITEGKKLSYRIIDLHRRRYAIGKAFIVPFFFLLRRSQIELLLVISKLLSCVAGLVSQEREKGQYLEQREWTGFARKKPFMLTPYPIAYAEQNHHPKTSRTLSSKSEITQLFPWNFSKSARSWKVCGRRMYISVSILNDKINFGKNKIHIQLLAYTTMC